MHHANMVFWIMVNKKRSCKQKWTNKEYHVKKNEDVEYQNVKIYYTANQFPLLLFCVPHNKPHGEHRLGKHSHMCVNQKLGHGTCAVRLVPCACTQCTSTIDKPWTTGISPH